MMEAVLYASEGETGFLEEYMESGPLRIQDYARGHMEDIQRTVRFLAAARGKQAAATSHGSRRSKSAGPPRAGLTSGSPRRYGCG